MGEEKTGDGPPVANQSKEQGPKRRQSEEQIRGQRKSIRGLTRRAKGTQSLSEKQVRERESLHAREERKNIRRFAEKKAACETGVRRSGDVHRLSLLAPKTGGRKKGKLQKIPGN